METDAPLLVTSRIAVLKILDGDTARVVGRKQKRTWVWWDQKELSRGPWVAQ